MTWSYNDMESFLVLPRVNIHMCCWGYIYEFNYWTVFLSHLRYLNIQHIHHISFLKSKRKTFWILKHICPQGFWLRDCWAICKHLQNIFLLLRHFEVKCCMCDLFCTHSMHWDYIWMYWDMKSVHDLNTFKESILTMYNQKVNYVSCTHWALFICCLFLPLIVIFIIRISTGEREGMRWGGN